MFLKMYAGSLVVVPLIITNVMGPDYVNFAHSNARVVISEVSVSTPLSGKTCVSASVMQEF